MVAGAPPSQLLLINAALQQSPFKYYIAMAAAGLNAAYGDTEAPLDAVLTPEGLTWLDNVDTSCAGDLRTVAAGLDFATLQKADPASVPAWKTVLEENDPGTWTTPIPAPLLIIHGGNDEQIPVVSSAALFTQLCAIGQVAQRWVYPDQSHAGVIAPSIDDMLTWIDHRFAGEPAPTPCSRRARRCPPPSPAPASRAQARPSGRGPWSRQEASQPAGCTFTRSRRPQVGQNRGGSSSRRHGLSGWVANAVPHQMQWAAGSGPATPRTPWTARPSASGGRPASGGPPPASARAS